MTPHIVDEQGRSSSGSSNSESGAERWVKWIAGISFALLVPIAGTLIGDRVDIAVLKSRQEADVKDQTKAIEATNKLLEKLVDQHQGMLSREDKIIEWLADDHATSGRTDRSTPRFSTGQGRFGSQ